MTFMGKITKESMLIIRETIEVKVMMSQGDNTTLMSFVGIRTMVTGTTRRKEVKNTRDYDEDISTTKVTTGTIREILKHTNHAGVTTTSTEDPGTAVIMDVMGLLTMLMSGDGAGKWTQETCVPNRKPK